MVLDILADRISASFKTHKANASVAEGRLGFGGPKIILAKPGTYMNNSGGPVSGLMKFYDVPLQNVIVVHDELDIDAGAVRVKQAGGHAGHNGLRDIIAAADSNDFRASASWHWSTTRPHGCRRLRAQEFLCRRAQRVAAACSRYLPMPSKRLSPRVRSRR
jgi:hypothetical protein